MRRVVILVTGLTALAQLAGFFKLWLTARYFGVGNEVDGYNLALVVPTLLSGMVSGVVQTGLFPVRAKIDVTSPKSKVEEFDRHVLWACVGVGLFLSMLVYMGDDILASLLVRTSSPETRETFIVVLATCAILVGFAIVNDCVGYLLAVRDKFLYAAAAPVANGILGGLVIVCWHGDGIFALVVSTVLGALAQLLICIFGLVRNNFRFSGVFRIRNIVKAARSIMAAGGWIVPGVVLSNITASLPAVWAAKFGEGAVSAFSYAYRMHTSAVQLLIMASSTIILARLSVLYAAHDHASISSLLKRAGRLSAVVGLAAILGTWLFGMLALEVVFGGKFDTAAASRVSNIWVCLSVGLGFALFGNVVSKLWQAQGRAKLMSIMAAISLVILFVIQHLLMGVFGELSIPMALSLMSVVNFAIGVRLLGLTPGVVCK